MFKQTKLRTKPSVGLVLGGWGEMVWGFFVLVFVVVVWLVLFILFWFSLD